MVPVTSVPHLPVCTGHLRLAADRMAGLEHACRAASISLLSRNWRRAHARAWPGWQDALGSPAEAAAGRFVRHQHSRLLLSLRHAPGGVRLAASSLHWLLRGGLADAAADTRTRLSSVSQCSPAEAAAGGMLSQCALVQHEHTVNIGHVRACWLLQDSLRGSAAGVSRRCSRLVRWLSSSRAAAATGLRVLLANAHTLCVPLLPSKTAGASLRDLCYLLLLRSIGVGGASLCLLPTCLVLRCSLLLCLLPLHAAVSATPSGSTAHQAAKPTCLRSFWRAFFALALLRTGCTVASSSASSAAAAAAAVLAALVAAADCCCSSAACLMLA